MKSGNPVAADGDTVGELEVRTPTVMDGYLHQPEATAALYTGDGWFRTGDVACVDQTGWYRIVGRESTDLIKSGGYRIGAGEVEAALLAHPAVQEAAVIGVPDDDLGQAIVAFVVADATGGAAPPGPNCPSSWPPRSRSTSGPGGSSWSTTSPATPWERCRRPSYEATSLLVPGSVPEWPKGAGCKPAGIAYGGSNPSRPTTCLTV